MYVPLTHHLEKLCVGIGARPMAFPTNARGRLHPGRLRRAGVGGGRTGLCLHGWDCAAASLVSGDAALSVPAIAASTLADGGQRLMLWAHEGDPLRRDLLARRGYVRQGAPEQQRRRPMDQPIPDFRPAEGYTVRALGDECELPARSWASWRAFHPDEPDDKYEGWEWYRNVQRAPLYCHDLDLVALAPDGELAAFCTVWFDDVTRTAAFEPVGTHPAHRRKGLGRVLLAEGLRRVQRLGATQTTVGSYSPAAGALHASVGCRCPPHLTETRSFRVACAWPITSYSRLVLQDKAIL